MAIFMKYEGITGESQVRGKTGFIELQGASLALARATAAAKPDQRGDAEVRFQELVCTRVQDSVSALLFAECATGQFDRTVDIEFITTGPNNRPITFLKYKLESCGISSYSSAASGDRPTETITLNFAKITIESFDVNDSKNAIPFTSGFDIAAGAAT